MRAISDRKLAEPYRSWISRTLPLPADVKLVPRSVQVTTDLLFFLLLGPMFGVMGGLFWLMFPPWRMPGFSIVYLFFGAFFSALWLVPLLLLRRCWITFHAGRDLKRGVLRQGVFLGPQGMLVRMEPNCCHPIVADRFVVAKLDPPASSRSVRQPTLIVETLDGEIRFFAERLAAGENDINSAARELWRSWTKPQPLMPKHRKKRKDVHSPRQMHRAAFFFGGSMLTVFAALGATIGLGEESPASSAIAVALLVGLLGVAASTVNMFYWFLSFKLSYRCPECRVKCPRVREALPDIHYYCPSCDIEWDTGLEESTGDSV